MTIKYISSAKKCLEIIDYLKNVEGVKKINENKNLLNLFYYKGEIILRKDDEGGTIILDQDLKLSENEELNKILIGELERKLEN